MIVSPITALLCVDDYVYCGIGQYLMIYIIESEHKKFVKIFDFERINGLCYCNGYLLVTGAYCITLYCIENDELRTNRLDDRILDCKLDSKLRIMTGTRQYMEFDYKMKCIYKYQFKGNAKLYSACIGNELFYGASVFGYVSIWDLSGHEEVIKIHDGFIFKLKERNGHLLTCSEDRSVKSTNLKTRTTTIYRVDLSRVWNVDIVNNYLFAVSEDAGVHVFPYFENSQQNQTILPITILKGHEPKHVWSICSSIKYRCLFTGGNDGGLMKWPLEINLNFVQEKEVLTHSAPKSLKNENIQSIYTVNEHFSLCTTNLGRLFKVESKNWTLLRSFNLGHYNVSALSYPYLAFGSISGALYVYDVELDSYQFYNPFKKERIVTILVQNLINNVYIVLQYVDNSAILISLSGKTMNQIKVDFQTPLHSFIAFKDNILFGERGGLLTVYNSKYEKLQELNAHDFQTITDIKVFDSMIITSGRDGSVNYYKYTDSLECVMKKKISKGWVEEIVCMKNQIFLVCFFRKHSRESVYL